VVRDVPVDEAGTTYGALIQQKYPEITEFNHIHHAGNSSGVVDGAAALLLASEAYMEKSGMTPRARIVATANMGDCPTLMLNAPVPAAEKGSDESRAHQRRYRCLGNQRGVLCRGLSALFANSIWIARRSTSMAARWPLVTPLARPVRFWSAQRLMSLSGQGGRYALITMCAAGGMAPAIIIERV
jgi:acetyl-CoA C-acetyltransferase